MFLGRYPESTPRVAQLMQGENGWKCVHRSVRLILYPGAVADLFFLPLSFLGLSFMATSQYTSLLLHKQYPSFLEQLQRDINEGDVDGTTIFIVAILLLSAVPFVISFVRVVRGGALRILDAVLEPRAIRGVVTQSVRGARRGQNPYRGLLRVGDTDIHVLHTLPADIPEGSEVIVEHLAGSRRGLLVYLKGE